MHAAITQDLISKLPREHVEIHDTKLSGFLIRCRPSGYHSFIVKIDRRRNVTLGRAAGDGAMTVAEARSHAKLLQGGASSAASAAVAADPSLTLTQARAVANAKIKAERDKRASSDVTLRAYLTDTYGPWVTANQPTGDDTLASLLSSIFEPLHDTALSELSAFAIEKWRTKRHHDDEVTGATTDRNLAALRGALSRAVEWKLLTEHPMESVKAAGGDATEHIRYLTPAETTRLLDALDARDKRRHAARKRGNTWRRVRKYAEFQPFGHYTDHLTPLVLTALQTGLRRGELFALVWGDINLLSAQLKVRSETSRKGGKGGKSRVLPLNDDAVKVLRAWRPVNVKNEALVFPGADGAPLVDIKTAWSELLAAAEIEHFRFHDCRHDYASRLVMAGVDLNTVRELLGHSDIKMTLRYAHLAPEHKSAAVAKLVLRRTAGGA